jgi:tricorn protease
MAKTYDWEKLQTMLYQLPVKSGSLNGLQAAEGWLYWLDYGVPGARGNGTRLMALKIKESKKYEPVEIATGVSGFTLSANKKRLLISFRNRTITVDDANGQKIDADKSKLSLDNWSFQVDPVDDWKEMFADAWRMMRDYFYDRDSAQGGLGRDAETV